MDSALFLFIFFGGVVKQAPKKKQLKLMTLLLSNSED